MSTSPNWPGAHGYASFDEALRSPWAVGETRSALRFFRDRLGNEWPGWREQHPFAFRFPFRYNEANCLGVQWFNACVALGDVANLDQVVKALAKKPLAMFRSGEMALWHCAAAKLAGHEVQLIATRNHRCADAQLMIDGHWLAVEFKELHDHEREEAWQTLHAEVFNLLPSHLNTGMFAAEFAAAALKNPSVIAREFERITVTPDEDWHALPNSSGRARLATGRVPAIWEFPFTQNRPMKRIGQKIGSWAKQVASYETPRVVVVRAQTVRGELSWRNIEGTSARLVRDLVRRPSVSALVVCDAPESVTTPALRRLRHGIWHRRRLDGVGRSTLLVRNPEARFPLSDDMAEALVGEHGVWCAPRVKILVS